MKSGELRAPILQALLNLNAIGGNSVPHSDVMAEVLRILGKPDVNFLGEGAKGKPKFLTPYGNCAFDLRCRGCITQGATKGTWELTQAGLNVLNGGDIPPSTYTRGSVRGSKSTEGAAEGEEATSESASENGSQASEAPKARKKRTVKASVNTAVAAVATVGGEADGAQKAPEPEPAKPNGKQRRLAVLVAAPDGAPDWVKDSYLRTLVAANTACFGAWSPTVAACGDCALAHHCKHAQAAALSVLAAALVQEDVSAKALGKLHQGTGAALADAAPRSDVQSPPEGKPMKSTFDGICVRSGAEIKAGEDCYYVAGEGVVCAAAYTGAAA